MDKIIKALNSALSLLDQEVTLIKFEDLRDEYLCVIDLLEKAIKEIQNTEK